MVTNHPNRARENRIAEVAYRILLQWCTIPNTDRTVFHAFAVAESFVDEADRRYEQACKDDDAVKVAAT